MEIALDITCSRWVLHGVLHSLVLVHGITHWGRQGIPITACNVPHKCPVVETVGRAMRTH